ncbi:unnamed protein product [Blepharisma stoltei]|uniref:Glutathione S-transferase n=1 Tax=Blepharisma stoltei TaxID=1481888 RepID=A0AAU9KB61_9CILI|nr:unnamed protein product [Blepharisma stoltei]
MSGITVHYFDIYGRADVIRMILHYAGAAFEDHKIQFQEWPQLKGSGFAEFSQLPIVDVDGHRLAQTQSISRYLCNKFGYGAAEGEETYWTESLCDLCEDIGSTITPLAFNKDFEGLSKVFTEKVPEWLRIIEARLDKNNGGSGYFVGNHPTRADFHVFAVLHNIIEKFHPETLEGHNKLRQWKVRFLNSSRTLKTFLETREPRDF